MSERITANFTWRELTRGSDLQELTEAIEANIERLVRGGLQPLRDAFGWPIVVNSGWRDPVKNASVKGHPSSYHLDGLAADIDAYFDTPIARRMLWNTLLASDIPFDKVCLYPTFIHVGFARPGRTPRRLAYTGADWGNRRHIPYPEDQETEA